MPDTKDQGHFLVYESESHTLFLIILLNYS